MARIQLFLSAVTAEFASHREALRAWFARPNLTAKIQEDFIAGGRPTLEELDDYIRQCEAVIHLVGDDPGFIAGAESIRTLKARHPDMATRFPALAAGLDEADPVFTYTQWEAYLAALHDKVLVICKPQENFARSNGNAPPPGGIAAQAAHLDRLENMERFAEIKFSGTDNLVAQLYRSAILDLLAAAGIALPHRVQIAKLPTTFAKKLYGREGEMNALDDAWAGETANMVVIDAMGGTGKTALLSHFVAAMGADDWRGAEAVYVWSFYSQGTDEKRQGDADEFFSHALDWFGYDGKELTSAHAKGEALAELVKERRTLLLLDGLEPLQYGAGRSGGGTGTAGMTGGIKDAGIAKFLKDLARDQPGLAIVTTRLPIPDLADVPEPSLRKISLQHVPLVPPGAPADAALSEEQMRDVPAVQLLDALGVKGRPGELHALARDLGGHALALNLFGKFLAEFHDGDILRRDLLPDMHEMRETLDGYSERRERDPFRVMRTYEIQFEQQISEQLGKGKLWSRSSRLKNMFGLGGLQLSEQALGTAAGKQLSMLQILGLFDRPVARAVIDELLRRTIRDLTDGLGEVRATQWDYAIQGLRKLGLILPVDKARPEQIDAHPLVREYFSERLEKDKPEAFRAAHGWLYEYYKLEGLEGAFRELAGYGVLALLTSYPHTEGQVGSVIKARQWPEQWLENLPPSLKNASWEALADAAKLIGTPAFEAAKARFLPADEEGMKPLFAAIAHGCAAGRHTEAFSEVYWPRVARGNEKFATQKLGLFGAELSAVAQFFAAPFSRPADQPEGGLSEARQALVLNLAAFALRALGRLGEAVVPFREAVARYEALQDPTQAAINASNLSELLLTLGRATGPDGALAAAEAAIAHADRSRRPFHRMAFRTTLADARHWSGDPAAAEALFTEAERLQAEMQPTMPRLYSVRGYKVCDLLLSRGRAAEVLRRYEYLVKVRTPGDSLLDFALEELAAARAQFQVSGTKYQVSDPDLIPDTRHLTPEFDTCIAALRDAGDVEMVVRGLLARAAFARASGDMAQARKDLAEAFEVAGRGGMKLFLIDCQIESARQCLAGENPSPAAIDEATDALDNATDALARACALIHETGLKRRLPELCLTTARLRLTQGADDAARTALEKAIAAIAPGWWGHLDELEELIARAGFSDLEADAARLREKEAAWNAEADRRWQAHDAYAQEIMKTWRPRQQQMQAHGVPEALIDHNFARDDWHAVLAKRLAAAGQDLDTLTIEQQRQAAWEFLAERQGWSLAAAAPSGPSDAEVDAALADPEARATIAKILSQNGHDLEALSPDEQREAARQLIQAVQPAQAAHEQQQKLAAIPDELVAQVLTTPELRQALADALAEAGIDTPLDDLPEDQQQAYARQFIAARMGQ